MKIKILKENEEKTITQRRNGNNKPKKTFQRSSLEDFEDFEDSFDEPASLEPLDKEDYSDTESAIEPQLMMTIKKVVEQELRNPEVLRAIAELIRVR